MAAAWQRRRKLLDRALGHSRLKHWRTYGEEELARREVAPRPGDDGLVVEQGVTLLSL